MDLQSPVRSSLVTVSITLRVVVGSLDFGTSHQTTRMLLESCVWTFKQGEMSRVVQFLLTLFSATPQHTP